MSGDKKIIIIPTYNEIENVEKMLRKVMSLEDGFNVLIIDDGSPDGTAAVVKKLMTEFPERLFIIERAGKLGLGTAYITGFKWSLEHGYDYIFEMDCDFSHNPTTFRAFTGPAAKTGPISLSAQGTATASA